MRKKKKIQISKKLKNKILFCINFFYCFINSD